MLADHGVDDVHIVIALGLHRRMHDWEIKRMVGQKVWDEYWPDRLYNHDGCDPDGMVVLGHTAARRARRDEPPRRRERPDDLRQPQLRADERRQQVDGRRPVRLREPQGAPHAARRSSSRTRSWIRRSSYLSHSFKRQGDLIENTLKVFHIETVLNNRAFDGPLSFLTKNEDDFTESRSPEVPGDEVDARQAAVRRAPRDLHAHAGRVRDDRLLRRRVRSDARPHGRRSRTSRTASRSTARPTSC